MSTNGTKRKLAGSFEVGRQCLMLARVTRMGADRVRVVAEIDGDLATSWEGSADRLESTQRENLAVSTWDCMARLTAVRLQMLSGEGRLLQPGAMANANAEPAGDRKCYELGPHNRLEGEQAPQIAGQPFRVTATVRVPGEGVIVAHGGSWKGYALYVNNGRLGFTVRTAREKETTILATQQIPPNRFVVKASLASDGRLTLTLNGKQVAVGKAPGPIATQPEEPLEVGRDTAWSVGPYKQPNPFQGRIERVVVEVGE